MLVEAFTVLWIEIHDVGTIIKSIAGRGFHSLVD